MAITQNLYDGDGSTTAYPFTFPYLKQSDIKVQLDANISTAWSLSDATTVTFDSAPGNDVRVKIYRETDTDTAPATFYAGSAIKSEDLNDNFTQNLYSNQEVNARYLSNLGGTMVGNLNMGEDTKLIFEGATDDAHETTLTVADPTADRTITLPNVTGTVVTTGDTGTVTSTMIADATIVDGDIANTTITGGKLVNDTITATQIATNAVGQSELAGDAVTGAHIVDDAIDSEHYAVDSIDTEHYAANSVDTTALADDAVTGVQLAANAVDSHHYVDFSIDTVHIAADAIQDTKIADNAVKSEHITDTHVTASKLAADSVNGSKIADDSIDSEHYVNESIDSQHIGNLQVTNAKIANDAVNASKIADDSIDSEHYVNESIDAQHIADNNITTAKIADANVTLAKLASNSVDSSKIVNANVTVDKIGNDAVTADKLLDHASDDSQRAVTTDHIKDNAVTIAKLGCEETTLTTNSDVKVPTSKAVADHVANVVDSVGGFKIIANKDIFPEAHPDPKGDAGMVISITDPVGFVVNGSGVSTTGDTITSDGTVTINGFPSDVHSTTTTSNYTLLLQTTSTAHTYDFYRFLAKDADVLNLSDDIQDFGNRYRTAANRTANNSNTNHDGDLFYDQTANKMYVYDGAYDSGGSWKEVTSTGEFKILTIVNTGQSHDGTLSVNGSQDDYDLFDGTNAASINQAAQLIVSLNGVIQKPNSGTFSGSAEGFYLEGSNGIKFCDPPPANSSIFVTQSGSAVTLSVPADDSVTAAKINAGTETTGHFLQKSASGSGLVWAAAADSDKIEKFDSKVEVSDTDGNAAGKISFYIDNNEQVRIDGGTFIADGFPLRLGDIGGTYTNSLHIAGHSSTDHNISSGYRDIKFQAGGVNNNVNTYHDWIKLIHSPGSGSTATKVELYASNTKRLETSTTGVTVTGTVAATAYTGDGSALTGIASTSIGGCGYQNDQEITGTQSIPANKGMHSVGPITNSGTVTVSGRWVIS